MFNPGNSSVAINIHNDCPDVNVFKEAHAKHGQVVFFISGDFESTAKKVREGLPDLRTDTDFICVPTGTDVPNIMETINENSTT